MNRCRYCGKEIRGTSDFCGQSCETYYQEAVEKDSRKIPYFIVGMGVGFLVLLCGVLLQIDWVLGVLLIGVGIWLAR